jgi:hypothetical protein
VESAAEGRAADVFGPGDGNEAAQSAADVQSLSAKIGELTLENHFLEGALTKAGLLSESETSHVPKTPGIKATKCVSKVE